MKDEGVSAPSDTPQPGITDDTERGVWYSVGRSLFNQYWMYSFTPISMATFGMTIGAFSTQWNWKLWTIVVAFFWITDQGMRTLDLSEDELATDLNSTVQRGVGYLMVGAGAVIGVFLAMISTLGFLVILCVGIFLGLAYNLEWWNGLFHHRNRITGPATFGVTLGGLSTLTGYVVLVEQVTLGILVIGLAPTLVLTLSAPLKPAIEEGIHETAGVTSERDTSMDSDDVRAYLFDYLHVGNLIVWIILGIGLFFEAVLGGGLVIALPS